ncbi:hypothetical protein B0T17DRAFT_650180 [Bombardia bombarda]|uniref:Uncharacterized protein n=1 Tax=Bombardia bombarda TaxID=252184 RepID=A0AA39XL82_9PEZI|nr:hypothetical protein B0T17DRAFT_650180 [Bombardia bombarda]
MHSACMFARLIYDAGPPCVFAYHTGHSTCQASRSLWYNAAAGPRNNFYMKRRSPRAFKAFFPFLNTFFSRASLVKAIYKECLSHNFLVGRLSLLPPCVSLPRSNALFDLWRWFRSLSYETSRPLLSSRYKVLKGIIRELQNHASSTTICTISSAHFIISFFAPVTMADQAILNVEDGTEDIAMTFHLEKMRTEATGRRPFQKVWLWTSSESAGKATVSSSAYNVKTDGPEAGGLPSKLPRAEELIPDENPAKSRLYLEVGLIIGNEPLKYKPVGARRSSKKSKLERGKRGVLPRDPTAMRVFAPVTENIASQKKYYVGCMECMGKLYPRLVEKDVIFFYPEFWVGVDQSMRRIARVRELTASVKYHTATNKSRPERLAAPIAEEVSNDGDDDDAMESIIDDSDRPDAWPLNVLQSLDDFVSTLEAKAAIAGEHIHGDITEYLSMEDLIKKLSRSVDRGLPQDFAESVVELVAGVCLKQLEVTIKGARKIRATLASGLD